MRSLELNTDKEGLALINNSKSFSFFLGWREKMINGY